MKKSLLTVTLLIILVTCQPDGHNSKTNVFFNSKDTLLNQEKPDLFYHYSVWYAFVNLVFDGTLTAKELKTKGDIALGSYNGLNGELIMTDGKLYQVTEDGAIHVPGDEELICYANATFFDSEQGFEMEGPVKYEFLRAKLNEELPSKNQFYAFRIKGDFSYMKCGSIQKQVKPYKTGLDKLLPVRPVFEKENISGTMVGFFCPDFIGDINVIGYHMHFINDDASFGGHVMDFESRKLKVEIDYITEYQFVLPRTQEYLEGEFKNTFQYGAK